MISALHPFMLIVIAATILALISIAIAFIARNPAVKVAMIVLALLFVAPAGYLFLALNPELVDGRFRTYKAFYKDIQVGMTREQVYSLLDRFYPKDGPRKRPKISSDSAEQLGFFMDPEKSSEPNCEGIFLTLENERITKKVYSAD
jgi:hypothetical protein